MGLCIFYFIMWIELNKLMHLNYLKIDAYFMWRLQFLSLKVYGNEFATDIDSASRFAFWLSVYI